MTLRRHKIIVSDNCWHQAVVRPDGQWVRYSDAEREIASLRAQLAAAEANCDAELTAALMAAEERHKADKLAAMERVREAAAEIANRQAWAHGGAHFNAPEMNSDAIAKSIRDIDLDALAEGET